MHDPPEVDAVASSDLPLPSWNRPTSTARRVWKHIHWGKIALFLVSLFLFILALTLMKDGARSLAPLVRDSFRVTNPVNSLGFGWLFAYVVMSGSPVAAAALTFFDAGVITQLETFTMITGSRMAPAAGWGPASSCCSSASSTFCAGATGPPASAWASPR